MPLESVRADADACPGALRLHVAADGPLARVRVPGGRLTGAQLRALRELAERWGDGHLELTSRANLQLRALNDAPPAELAARLQAAGLLPSETHELVRNIVASPLAGGLPIADLDEALCADEVLAGLPGRFLLALDDGTGDVAFSADAAAFPLGREVAILFAGVDAGLRVPPGAEVRALLAAGHAFLAERAAQRGAAGPAAGTSTDSVAAGPSAAGADTAGSDIAVPGTGAGPGESGLNSTASASTSSTASAVEPGARRVAWRVRELIDGPARVAARTAAALGVTLSEPAVLHRPEPSEPVGVIALPDGAVAVGALVPLGRLGAVAMRVLESAPRLVFTTGRGVVLPGLTPEAARQWSARLAEAGLEVAAGSRWTGVTACAGRPGCAKSLADVRADATAATVAGEGLPEHWLPVHWVGCARGCGSPAGPHVRVEATGTGYEVRSPQAGGSTSVGEVGALVGAARKG